MNFMKERGDELKGSTRKAFITISLTVVMITAVCWYGKVLITRKIGEQVVTIIQTPTVQDAINQVQKNPSVVNQIQQIAGNNVQGLAGNAGQSLAVNSGGIKQTLVNPQQNTNQQLNQQTSDTASSTSSSFLQSASPSNGSYQASAPSSGNIGSNQSQSVQSPSSSQANSTAASLPTLKNRQDAVNFAMSRFTSNDILKYFSEYENRKNLTAEQKAAIKSEILSHFTPQEIQAMLAVSNK